MIENAMVDMSQWLDDHPKNVVAIHCKAGKGRTGMLVCCLLYWRKYFRTMQESLDFFARMRTHDMDGVSIPSQKRYVLYFEQWLTRAGCCAALAPHGPPYLRVKYVRMDPAPKDVGARDCHIVITQSGGRCWRGERLDSRDAGLRAKIVGKGIPNQSPSIEFDWSPLEGKPLDLHKGGVVRGDVRIEIIHKGKRLLRFWFHTAFITESTFLLRKDWIDGPHKDRKGKHYDPSFAVEVLFDLAPASEWTLP
jgi:phosphatidylinositol-3,4,5-trisphosphate 3-phosphatase/dual-specificity protein phosphatase PTEN